MLKILVKNAIKITICKRTIHISTWNHTVGEALQNEGSVDIPKMKIAIIGAGAAGLISAKYAVEEGFECDVFEQTGVVGGTWVYTDRIGTDENGLPVLTGMYKNLKTNLPKEVMAFLDFPYPEEQRSYIYQPDVLAYLERFTIKSNLYEYIRFYKQVIHVEKFCNSQKWCVTVKDAKTKEESKGQYDAVMVCNGHYFDQCVPNIQGMEKFKGTALHSHEYRSPGPFRNKSIVVVGAGPSGLDVMQQTLPIANKVYISEKTHTCPNYHSGLEVRGVIKEINEKGVLFENEKDITPVDVIIFCTGYNYKFPFLRENSKIKIINNQVLPLYKHIINIEYPTMGFIGIPFYVCPFPLFDIQARYFLATLKNPSILPPKASMYNDLDKEVKEQAGRGLPMDKFHYGGEKYQPKYFQELAELGNLRPIPNVINKIFCKTRCKPSEDNFKIIDDENFVILGPDGCCSQIQDCSSKCDQ